MSLIPLLEEAKNPQQQHLVTELMRYFQVSFPLFTAGVVEHISVVGRIILTINHHLERPDSFFKGGGCHALPLCNTRCQ